MTELTTRKASTPRRFGIILREVIGWALLVWGLAMFWQCFGYLNEAQVVEGLLTVIMGVVLFRGGLQLVKVATAAQALRHVPRRDIQDKA